MKIYRMKTAILLISYILYIFLTGCSRKVPTQSQEVTGPVPTEAAAATQTAIPTETVIFTQPENSNQTVEPSVTDKPSTEGSQIAFRETSETVYATGNVNIRSACTTADNNVITTLQKGDSIKRIGFNEQWSKVLYNKETGYIKTSYLSLEKPVMESDSNNPKVTKAPAPTPKPTAPPAATQPPSASNDDPSDTASQEDIAAKFKFAPDISQLVLVVGGGGSDCTVSFHKKDDNGKWTQEFSTNGDCGSKGITYHKKEGDGKTPAGLYSFTMAFGIKSDPGAKLTYRKVTKYDYWIDDSESPYYNTWINALETPGEYTSEHLIDHAPQYNYALNINYNQENTPGLGSAIFLHGYNGLGRTTGCVAIAEKYVKTLIQEIDCSAKILIVPDSSDLANYE